MAGTDTWSVLSSSSSSLSSSSSSASSSSSFQVVRSSELVAENGEPTAPIKNSKEQDNSKDSRCGMIYGGLRALNDGFWEVDRRIGHWLHLQPRIEKEDQQQQSLLSLPSQADPHQQRLQLATQRQPPQLKSTKSAEQILAPLQEPTALQRFTNSPASYLPTITIFQPTKTVYIIFRYEPPRNGGERYESYIPGTKEEFWYHHPEVWFKNLVNEEDEMMDGEDWRERMV